MGSFMDKEKIADINNKLTPAHTALDLLSQDKPVSKEFIETALKSLREAESLIKKRGERCKQVH